MRLGGRLAWLAFAVTATPCCAETVRLVPANTEISLTVYVFGAFPQSGHYARFTGTLLIDPVNLRQCQVDMQVDGESLQMGDAPRTRFALSPSLLDAAHYPSLRFTGNCNSARTVGALNLHGVTRPLILVEKRRGNRIIATGTLHRQDYGIRGAPGWIGGSIAITFSVDLPASIAAQLPATN